MTMIGYIYHIKNKKTGKVYIGSTKNFKRRKYAHFSKLKKGTHRSLDLQKDFNKLGIENFEMNVVLEQPIKDKTHLIFLERKAINEYKKPKYNLRVPGIPTKEHTLDEELQVYEAVNL